MFNTTVKRCRIPLRNGKTERLAPSLSARIEQLIATNNESDPPMSDAQIAMLQRALAHDGLVSKKDYDLAWSNYQQCVISKGYTAPVATPYPEGLRGTSISPNVGDRGDEVMMKVINDAADCKFREYQAIDEMYTLAKGNPNLYQDREVGFAECLRRNGLTEPSYTAQQYKEEYARSQALYSEKISEGGSISEAWDYSKQAFSYDFDDAKVQLCYITNRLDVKSWGPDDADHAWYPFGE